MRQIVTVLALATVLAAAALATAGGERTLRRSEPALRAHGAAADRGAEPPGRPADRSALRGLVVTSGDPAALLADGAPFDDAALETGPFDARSVDDLHVVAILDRRVVGDAPFDQITRFVLPDGHVYERRITPVDPAGTADATASRAELGPLPVPVRPVRRLRRVARLLPEGASPGLDPRHASFTSVVLPVSGTFITKHALYGTWTVEVAIVRDRQTVATTSTTFQIDAR